MIDDMLSNKKRNWILNELSIGGRKLIISLVLMTQFYFGFPKILLN